VTATNATTFSVGALNNGAGATAGPLTLNNSTATITNGLGLTYNGVISGSGSVVKQGTGVQTLGGASTYTGTTTVNGGSLFVNGSLSAGGGQVTVNSGGTIGGTGTINRDVLANTGGVIKPGASPGILTVAGTVTMSAGAIHGFEYTAPVVTAAYDSGGSAVPGNAPATGIHNQLIVNGNYVVNPAAIFRVAGNAADFSQNVPYSFQVGAVTGTINGGAGFNITNPGQFDFSGFTGFVGATNLQWHNVGGAVYFNFTPVPEPLHILAVAGLGAAGFRWVRKRRKTQAV
jgi:autotransporter-associated beta strand protein